MNLARIGAAGVVIGWAAWSLAAEKTDLQVKRVAMFSSGVAFFQREATVTGSSTAELRFRTEQINDILKSLVVQDLGGGKVGVVSYASKDPLERTLKSFAVDLTEDPSMANLLQQLRGQPVEIGGPRQLKGVIVGVEEQQIPGLENKPMIVHFLNVLTDTGLQQLRIDQLQGVKLSDEKVAAELNKALATLAASHDTDKKTVLLHFDGDGQRRVQASFLLESPIWKTSYRLVLSSEHKPFLQAWAAVENATEEDWKEVQLSLVSGRPISFQMDLYSPIYVPRPLEDIELYAALRAPEFEGGMGGGGEMAGKPVNRFMSRSEARPLAETATPPAPAAPAEAPQRPRGFVSPDALASPDTAGNANGYKRLRLTDQGVTAVADAKEAGELFEYAIQTPVSIPRQSSALLPIINQDIAGEKLSVFAPGAHPKHPLHAFMLENSTDLHLMQGPVTIFDGDTYAGDAKLPDVKPGEKRLIAYALDLGMEVLSEGKAAPTQSVSVRIGKGTLTHKIKLTEERTYTVRNKDRKDRTLLIEHPYRRGWNLLEPKEPFERTETTLRFRLAVPADKTVTQAVRLETVVEQGVALSELGLDAINMHLQKSTISAAVAEALKKAAALRTDLDEAVRQRTQGEKEVAETVQEQGRIRENLKTLQQNTDAYQRQLKKFDDLETRIEKQREMVASLRSAEEQKRKLLGDYLGALEVE